MSLSDSISNNMALYFIVHPGLGQLIIIVMNSIQILSEVVKEPRWECPEKTTGYPKGTAMKLEQIEAVTVLSYPDSSYNLVGRAVTLFFYVLNGFNILFLF